MTTGQRLREIHDRLFSAYGPQHWWPGETPFEVMVGAVLTQNTNWANVERAIANLKAAGALSPEAMAALAPAELAELIRPAGYYNIKAARLSHLLRTMEAHREGGLSRLLARPTDELRQKLLATKGVGPETADSILLYAASRPIFVVDAYTFRILGRHGLADESMGYFDLQEAIMDVTPHDAAFYNEFHALLVRLGKQRCKKSKPLCQGCPLEDF